MILLPSPLPLGVSICHDTTVMAYAAYLRVYEPVSAFREPDRSRWTAYADAPARPRRRDSLVAEHAEAVRRVITSPQVAVPEQESEHAYPARGWHYLRVPVADQAALPAGLRPDAVRGRRPGDGRC